MEGNNTGTSELSLQCINGFEGGVPSGLRVHPDSRHFVYPVGCSVIVEEIKSQRQQILSGHSNKISCMCISTSGLYIASGQTTFPGFKADTIVWNYETKKQHCKLAIHRNGVQDVSFSQNEKFLVTLGGSDDGSLVVWDLDRKEALCGSPAQSLSAGLTSTVRFLNNDNNSFITAGKTVLRVWNLDIEHRKLTAGDINLGVTKRNINNIRILKDDSYFVCGTTSGDLMAINLETKNFHLLSPEKERLEGGVTAVTLLESGRVAVGSGRGKIALLKSINERFKKTDKFQMLDGVVTSIVSVKNDLYVGTSTGNTYHLDSTTFDKKLLKTSHHNAVRCLCFPNACSDLLLSCSTQDIRLWKTKDLQELLRLNVANKTCNVVAITKDGKSILSGWDDGCIRAYYPESGRLMYVMDHAYGGSVTALTTFHSGTHVITGSNLGHVVLWKVPSIVLKTKQPLHVYKHTMLKEHKGEVTCIRMKHDDSECITSSIDGSCIFWDLSLKSRRQMIRVNTLFKVVCYHPQEHQILTAGTDRKIGYWETYDSSIVRELEGSTEGSVNCLDVSSCGKYFVSGGDDKLIKLWRYDEGEVSHVGLGHGTSILAVSISPDRKHIFSCSEDGAILKWTFPHN